MNNDKSVLTILTDTLATVAERTLVAEREQSAVKEERDQWFGFYTAQKKRADKLERELQAVCRQLVEAERNTARAELAALNEKGAEDHE
ncbi:MAG: hypothetical protein KH420_07710 [Clostridiales bacterium]|nr:hypothetical protein [Clostridiales bacterium]